MNHEHGLAGRRQVARSTSLQIPEFSNLSTLQMGQKISSKKVFTALASGKMKVSEELNFGPVFSKCHSTILIFLEIALK